MKYTKHQRVAILIDVQNLFYGAKNYYNKMVSYERLIEVASRKRQVSRILSYIVEKDGSNQDNFKRMLRRLGSDIRTKPLIERKDGSSKGNWDVAIAVDALQIAPQVDVITLVTGDNDFAYLVEALKYMGKRVEMISIPESAGNDLINAVDEYTKIPESWMM